jgi:glucose-6-phosphate isomerase
VSTTDLSSWKKLQSLYDSKKSSLVLKELFAADPKRFEQFQATYNRSTDAGSEVEIFLDYSKNLIDEEVWSTLLSLAKEASASELFLSLFASPALLPVKEGRITR